MSTKLSEPDSVIIEQFQEGEAMYLIAKGECMVIVGEESEDRFYKSNTTEEIDQNTMLRSGQYFGEISLVYGCKCTAKVVAKKYCTLAQLTKDKFRDHANLKTEWDEVIRDRILMPTFVGDVVMWPEYPLGRNGPRLEEFLRF